LYLASNEGLALVRFGEEVGRVNPRVLLRPVVHLQGGADGLDSKVRGYHGGGPPVPQGLAHARDTYKPGELRRQVLPCRFDVSIISLQLLMDMAGVGLGFCVGWKGGYTRMVVGRKAILSFSPPLSCQGVGCFLQMLK